MSDDFLVGVVAGMLFMAACWGLAGVAYRRTLLAIARARTPEKLPDGKFYFLVPEGEYVALTEHRRGSPT